MKKIKKITEKPSDLEIRMASLPDKRILHDWTPEMDRVILKFAPVKGVPAVAAVLGIPRATVDQRYRKILAGKK